MISVRGPCLWKEELETRFKYPLPLTPKSFLPRIYYHFNTLSFWLQKWLYTRQHRQWWVNVQDSYTHMYISCINSLLGLRGRCSWSVPLMRSWSTEGLLYTHTNRLHWRPSILTLQCWKLLWGWPIEQQKDRLSLRLGELLLIAGGREVQ